MTGIRIHEGGHFTQADEIAECMGVSEDTYSELWNKCVPLYDGKPRGECPGEITYSLADYGWDLLSNDAKHDVNRVLAKYAE